MAWCMMDSMPTRTPRVDTSTVLVTHGVPMSSSALWRRHVVAVRRAGNWQYHRQSADVLTQKGVKMPRKTEKTYRQNAGRESLDVRAVDGTLEEMVDILAAEPRSFFEFGLDEFVAEVDGKEIVPSAATSVKALSLTALRRGLVIGQGESGEESFLATVRGPVTKLEWLPKGTVEAMVKHRLVPEGFKVEAVEVDGREKFRLVEVEVEADVPATIE